MNTIKTPKSWAWHVLRHVAALCVIVSHSHALLGHAEPILFTGMTLGTLGVAIFFSLSGHMVAGSWQRDPHVIRFVIRRLVRILPGLWGCVLFTIFVWGLLLSELPASAYMQDTQTWAYLRNLWLQVQYILPGVVPQVKFPSVANGSLWSLPLEVLMYGLLLLLGICLLNIRYILISAGRVGKNVSSWLLMMVFGWLTLAATWALVQPLPVAVLGLDVRHIFIYGSFFWVGALLSLASFNSLLVHARGISVVAGFVWVGVLIWPGQSLVVCWLSSWVLLPVCVVVMGYWQVPSVGRHLPRTREWADFSYGLYLYAWPVQQALGAMWPTITVATHACATVLGAGCLAFFSWYSIERPFLSCLRAWLNVNVWQEKHAHPA